MTKLQTITKGLLGATAITFFTAGSAFAGGTAAGTNVQNTFTLSYDVGGTAQTPIDTGPGGSNTPTEFTVDRLVDLTVASSGNTTVAPGALDQGLYFTITNNGNDTQAYSFDVENETGDDFDASGLIIRYVLDNGTGGVCDATDQAAAFAAADYTPGSGAASVDVAADAVVCAVVVGDIGAGVVDTDEAELSLVADTLQPTTGTSPGTEVVADTGGNTLTGAAENVLADAAGTFTGDAATDGDHSATGTYIVASADLTASKTVTIFSQDGSGCDTIPGTPPGGTQYSIPGSCVEYVISATNNGATASATNIDIADILPTDLEFRAAVVGVFTGGSFSTPATGADCNAVTCTVSLDNASLAAGQTGSITIRALVK